MLPLAVGGLGVCAVVDTERTAGLLGGGFVEGQADGAGEVYGLEIEGRLEMGTQRARYGGEGCDEGRDDLRRGGLDWPVGIPVSVGVGVVGAGSVNSGGRVVGASVFVFVFSFGGSVGISPVVFQCLPPT